MTPPEMPEKIQPRDVPEMLIAMGDYLAAAQRELAGFNTLNTVYQQVTTGPKKERRKGLPILSYKGTLDGAHVLPLEVDLRKVPLDLLPQILSPLCHVHYTELMVNLTKLAQIGDQALRLAQAAGQTPEEPAEQEPEGFPEEPEEVTK
jgi:hypothetical protein